MAYRVETADRAVLDLEELYVEKDAAESQAAARWYNSLEEAISTLGSYPYRCEIVPEATKLKRELRHLLYGKRPHIYRVIYEVDEPRKTVWVLHIRHGARRAFSLSDLD